jgi:hypothetical protein
MENQERKKRRKERDSMTQAERWLSKKSPKTGPQPFKGVKVNQQYSNYKMKANDYI